MAGNNNVHRGPNKDKRIKAALNRYIDADPRRLDEFVQKWWAMAMGGDTTAFNQIADRVDGKVAQPVGGADDLPPVQLERIEVVIVDPKEPSSEEVQATP